MKISHVVFDKNRVLYDIATTPLVTPAEKMRLTILIRSGVDLDSEDFETLRRVSAERRQAENW